MRKNIVYPSRQKMIKAVIELEFEMAIQNVHDFIGDVIRDGYIPPEKWSLKELKEYYKENIIIE